MKYWVQTQAPAGNWVDSIGTNDLKAAKAHARYLHSIGETARVISREDTVVIL